MTGLCNNRGFYKKANEELIRSQRYKGVFTVAYIDLDNFKEINDNFGHMVGDELLQKVAKIMKENSRKTDVVARLGGDEFAILFSETGFQPADEAFRKLNHILSENISKSNWSTTLSAGLVTYEVAPNSVKQMVQVADDLMYSVKKEGKNNVFHKAWSG